MIQWISELGRVQPNSNSINEIFVRVGVFREEAEGWCGVFVGCRSVFSGGMREARTWHGLPRIFKKNLMSVASMIS